MLMLSSVSFNHVASISRACISSLCKVYSCYFGNMSYIYMLICLRLYPGLILTCFILHDEWNICIYMVAAASHIHANLQKQANPRFLFCTGPIAAPTRSADPVGARERFGGVKSVRRVYACTLHSPKVGTCVKCIGMIHDNCVTRCTRCACDSMRVQNIHA